MARRRPETLDFVQALRGNRLVFLKSDRNGQHRIRINDQRGATMKNGMRPVHPGEILREDYLVPLGLSARTLAIALHVPPPRTNDIIRERRGITADTALRLARYFGGDARSWLNLQAAYNLRVAETRNARRIEREVTPSAA